uniref:Uncharacterized protein n=1 Tax=Rhizophagus irregularis (strain DAOM 181602 / DAOM 197198 / MUCL 43194) TaxID=747089 RepID=U9U8N8_RHIID
MKWRSSVSHIPDHHARSLFTYVRFLTISILLGFEGAWKQEFFPPSATVHSVNFAAIFCGWNLMKIWMKLTDDFWKILLIRLSILSDYYLVTDLKLCEYTEVTSDSIIQNEMH